MAESGNHTLRLPREIRGAIGALDDKLDGKIASLDGKIDRNQDELQKRIDSLRQPMRPLPTLPACGEGREGVGRCATAEFDERLSALERRVSALECQG